MTFYHRAWTLLAGCLTGALLLVGCETPVESSADVAPTSPSSDATTQHEDCGVGVRTCPGGGGGGLPDDYDLSGDTDISGPIDGLMLITGYSQATNNGTDAPVDVIEVTTGGTVVEGSGSCTTEQVTNYDSDYAEATPYCSVQDRPFSNQDEAAASSTHYMNEGSLEVTKYSSDSAAF